MNVRYAHVMLAYSVPMSCSITFECTCKCGTRMIRPVVCYNYGRVHIGCTLCLQRETVQVSRITLTLFYQIHSPGGLQSLHRFLTSWEAEMRPRRTIP